MSLHASFNYIFAAKIRVRFCELDFSFGRRELRMIFISLYFFFITPARLIKPSEIAYGPLYPILFVPQSIITFSREGGKGKLFVHHSTFWILSSLKPKLKVLKFEKYLSNVELNLLKLAVSPINKALHFCELIARYAWFLKVSYQPAFPLRGTGVIREYIS